MIHRISARYAPLALYFEEHIKSMKMDAEFVTSYAPYWNIERFTREIKGQFQRSSLIHLKQSLICRKPLTMDDAMTIFES